MLALKFLILAGVVLIGEGWDLHIPKGYIHFGPDNARIQECGPALPLTGLWRCQLSVSKAIHGVVIDHADGLHERIAYGAAHKLEAAAFQLPAHRVGLDGGCGHLVLCLPAVQHRSAIDEIPQKIGKRCA